MLFLRYWWSRRANMFKWLGWYLFNKNALTPEKQEILGKCTIEDKCTKRERIKYCSYHHWSVKQNFVNFSGVCFDFALVSFMKLNVFILQGLHPDALFCMTPLSWSPSAPKPGCVRLLNLSFTCLFILSLPLWFLVGRTGSRVTRFSRLTTENTQLSWCFR